MAKETKKLSLLRILDILKNETDEKHPLTQEEIAEILENEYGIALERKSIGANISMLKEYGYDIVTNFGSGGTYLNAKDFEDNEIKLLIDAVIFSQYINESQSKDLIKKLTGLSNKYFTIHNKNFLTLKNKFKTDSPEMFYNMEIIDEAISEKKKISYDYVKYDKDKKKTKDSEHVISPFGYVLHNQRYYLFGYSDKYKGLLFHRLVWIENIEKLKDKLIDIKAVSEFKYGVNYENLVSARPYLFTDPLEKIVMKVDNKRINDVYDWFGKDVEVKNGKNDFSIISFKASPMAMKFWALQYLDSVEVMEPKKLRDNIKKAIKNAEKKYK